MGCHKQRAKRCEQSYKRRVFRRPSTRGRRNPAVCNSVRNAERRSRSYHGVGGERTHDDGWRIGWRVPFRRQPPRNAPFPMDCGCVAVAGCVSKPSEGVGLRGERVVPFSSGSAFARSNDNEKGISPRRAAPEGSLCEKCPQVLPSTSLTLRARRGGVWVRVIAFPNASPIPLPRAEGRVREKVPTWWLNCALHPR